VIEEAARFGGAVAAGLHRAGRVADVVGQVHGAQEDVQRGFECVAREQPVDRQFQFHLQRGE